jgi:hypothetical protein
VPADCARSLRLSDNWTSPVVSNDTNSPLRTRIPVLIQPAAAGTLIDPGGYLPAAWSLVLVPAELLALPAAANG